MAIKLASHLHKNRYGIYGFRIVIPQDLQVSLRRKEIRVSLRTARRAQAKSLASRLTVVTKDYFEQIRRAPTMEEAMVSAKELLDTLGGATFDSQTALLEELIHIADGKSQEQLQHLIDMRSRYSAVKAKKIARVQELVMQLPNAEDSEIDSLFCDLFADITPLMVEERSLAGDLNALNLQAQQVLQSAFHHQEIEALRETQQAKISEITDLAAEIAAKATQKASSTNISHPEQQESSRSSSKPLSAIVEAYCTNQISEGSWTEKTEAENRAIYALWVRIAGDQPIRGYSFEQHREYKAKLQRLPSNLNKSPRYRAKSIDEVLALGDKPAAPNTINKNLTRVSALFEWAIKYGYTTENPARGMTIKNPKKANEERQAFSDHDLRKLFGSPEYLESRHKHPYQYWVPLVALYTGARLNEICQIHLCDLVEMDGVSVIRITEEGGSKRLKTKAARRVIPIHPELTRLGFLDFADSLRQKGYERLFPELKEGRDGYGRAVSKWFASYTTRCGINAAGKVFHSFRHTFIDRLKQSEVTKEKIAALVGHEEESVTFGRYGKNYSSRSLAATISLLIYKELENLAPYRARFQ